MSEPSVPPKPRRLPKKGCFFTFARLAGLLLKITGGLLLAIALIGFVIVLVRIGPGLVVLIQNLDQQMAGFIFFTSLGALVVFPVLGLVGAAMVGLGFILSYVGTKAGGEIGLHWAH